MRPRSKGKVGSISRQLQSKSVSMRDRVILQHQVLLNISRSEPIDLGDLNASMKIITEATATGLGIERAGIWLYNEDKTAIICMDLFERSKCVHSSGIVLYAKDYPVYFEYLQEERTLAASNAHKNPATREFSDVYLKPLNINSMLDAPIRKNGKVVGVVCCEHVNTFKRWSLNDESFAGSIADLVARSMTSADRVRAQSELRELNENLEKIIEQRTLELDAQRAVSMQASKLASLGEMSAGIAHEINTPLTSIQLLSGQITEMAKTGKIKADLLIKMSGMIEETTVRIAKIISSLRTFSRDSSKDPFQVVTVSTIVDDTLAFCFQKIRNLDIDIQIRYDDSDTEIECRPIQIQQVLLNILSNAVDALEGLKGPKSIILNVRSREECLEICVVDNGPGVPEKIRDKIMQPFFTTKQLGKGTGLGLSVSNGIVRSHNGSLTLDEQNDGTCFRIKLPLRQAGHIQAA